MNELEANILKHINLPSHLFTSVVKEKEFELIIEELKRFFPETAVLFPRDGHVNGMGMLENGNVYLATVHDSCSHMPNVKMDFYICAELRPDDVHARISRISRVIKELTF